MNNSMNIYVRFFHERKTPMGAELGRMEHKELVVGPVGVTMVFGTLHLHGPSVNDGFTEVGTDRRYGLILFGNRYFSDIEIHQKEDLKDLPKHDLLDYNAVSGLKLDVLDNTATYTFMSKLVRQYSGTEKSDDLGEYDNTMVLKRNDERGSAYIEWTAEPATGEGEPIYEEIGITFDERRVLLDYDGIMSLPKQAVTLLRFAGIEVPPDDFFE